MPVFTGFGNKYPNKKEDLNMDFHLTREQELVRQMMHDFTENEVKPIAAETDKTSTYPARTSRSCSIWALWA